MAIIVRKLDGTDDYRAIARLRYDVYVSELGIRPRDANDAEKTIVDEFNSAATILGAFDGERAVATGRMLQLNNLPKNSFWRAFYDTELAPFPEEKQVIYSRLMVTTDFRGTDVILRLLAESYNQSRALGTELMYMHCAPSLVALYEVIGCRRYKKGEIDPDVGFRLPMALVLGDIDHLVRVRSPLAPAAMKFPASPSAAEWFRDRFPEYSQPASVRMMSEEEFAEALSRYLDSPNKPLFAGLGPEQIREFIQSSVLIDVGAGDQIMRKGDVGTEMYLVLEGAVEISTSPNGSRRLLRTLGDGQFFGEGGFLLRQPRSADATAIMPTKILSISAQSFSKISEDEA